MSAPLSLPRSDPVSVPAGGLSPAAGGRGPGQADHRPVRSVRRPPGLSGRRPPPVHRPPLTLVCPDDGEARRLAGDLSAPHRGGGAGSPRPGLPLSPRGRLPPVGAPAPGNSGPAPPGDCPVLVATVEGLLQRTMPPRGLRRQLPPAPCGPGLSAGGAHRLSGSGGVHPVRPGGGTGQFALRGHSGRLLPRPGPAGADGILGGMRSTPWACLTR